MTVLRINCMYIVDSIYDLPRYWYDIKINSNCHMIQCCPISKLGCLTVNKETLTEYIPTKWDETE